MHNLTYQERARFAYAAGNGELAEALTQLAEKDDLIEQLNKRNADLLDVAHEVLPHIKAVAEEDEGSKAGAVAHVLRNLQAVL